MKNLTYEAILENPELLQEVLRNARRERAEAIAPGVLAILRKLLG